MSDLIPGDFVVETYVLKTGNQYRVAKADGSMRLSEFGEWPEELCRLIAALPDLVEALRDISAMQYRSDKPHDIFDAGRVAADALRKAWL